MSLKYDPNVKYAKTDEWARVEGDLVVVGISDYAQDQLSDIVYVELPEVGAQVSAGEVVGTVESVKAAADIMSPVSGEIVEVNEELNDSPELLNEDPYGAWIFKVKPNDLAELDNLMTAEEYEAYNATREH
ncbi:MAG TPA: glycine cleavage system protein GcvH [Anaerolineae bacterium]|nr:glycine cleavage system protein GcvH [Anaerolineae bacterium]